MSGTTQAALRRIGLESLLGLLILSVTGLLTLLPPGVHALHQLRRSRPRISRSAVKRTRRRRPRKNTVANAASSIRRRQSAAQI